jgi:glucan-binding YG repeat protein
MLTGWIEQWDSWYYFNNNGAMRKNEWLKQSNGQTFYLGSDGIKYIGTHTIDNAVYIFNNAGVLERKWEVINGSNHIFDKDGTMLTGWIEQWDSWYYFNNDGAMRRNEWLKQSNGQTFYLGSNGVKVVGTHIIDNATYIFNSAGILQRKWEVINGSYHVFNPDNVMLKGWIEEWGASYYFNPSNGAMVKGSKTIDGKTYFFNAQGVMQTNVLL